MRACHVALLALCLAVLSPRAARSAEQSTGTDLLLYRVYSDPLAVCNDGSPGAPPRGPAALCKLAALTLAGAPLLLFLAGYYFSPANDTTKSNLWLIYLEGGQARPSCAQQPPATPLADASVDLPTPQPAVVL